MTHQLHWYNTKKDNKWEASDVYKVYGDAESIFMMWYVLHKQMKEQHVEVYDLMGHGRFPEDGLNAIR